MDGTCHIQRSSPFPPWRAWSTMVAVPNAVSRPTTLTGYGFALMVILVMV